MSLRQPDLLLPEAIRKDPVWRNARGTCQTAQTAQTAQLTIEHRLPENKAS